MSQRRTSGLLILFGFALLWSQWAAAKQEILRPEQAFQYDVQQVGDRLQVDWLIEPEHYLYQERMSFASRTEGFVLGEPDMPAGKKYTDEFFGEMHIYRNSARILIPLTSVPAGGGAMTLELRSQGCADIGLCYPPQTWTTSVTVTPVNGETAGSAPKLSRLLGGGGLNPLVDEPLPADIAFQPIVDIADPFTLRVRFAIHEGYYVYRDSLAVAAAYDNTPVATGQPQIPPGIMQYDEHFGDTAVFYDELVFTVPLTRASPAATPFTLLLDYQGCKKDSICYPPESLTFDIDLPAASANDSLRTLPASPDSPDSPDSPQMVSEQDRMSDLIVNGQLFAVMLAFLGAGLLLAFTPCVLPMVPILSGIITGQGKDVTSARAFALSLTYVLGMALTYTAAGAAVGAVGGQLQAVLQKPWIIISVAGLFGVLAMSMFGFYEIQMPAAIQNRLTRASNQQSTGTFVGTAIMGALSALVVTTCVAPPLVAALAVIAETGDVVRGAAALFAMSMGMGIPLLVIGTSAGKLLPKAGAWMNGIKIAFGYMMLGLAIWMLERLLPGAVTMVLWAALFVGAGVSLGSMQSLPVDASGGRKFAKAAGLMATVYGAALLIGGLSGSTNPLQPLQFAGNAQQAMEFKRIKTVADLEREVQQASAAGRSVMLDFYADWCVSCKEMEHYTFVDEAVQQNLGDTLLLQADVTENDDADQALLRYFNIYGPPTIVFFDASGNEKPEYRVVGFMSADEFARHVGLAVGS